VIAKLESGGHAIADFKGAVGERDLRNHGILGAVHHSSVAPAARRVLGRPSQYPRYDCETCKYFGGTLMKSSIVKRLVVIDGHKTSVTLEDPSKNKA
jgi:hypothetical protein